MAYSRPSTKLRRSREASFLGKCIYLSDVSSLSGRNKQTAVIKEALRIGVPTPAGHTRVVPPSGAVISGVKIPGGVRVSCPSVIGSCLMPLEDSREPELPLCIVFRRNLCSTARVPSRPVASARIQSLRQLSGGILERTA
jgi:hypothetical protein